MKKHITILFILIVNILVSQINFNDLSNYGFKGKVKSLRIEYYDVKRTDDPKNYNVLKEKGFNEVYFSEDSFATSEKCDCIYEKNLKGIEYEFNYKNKKFINTTKYNKFKELLSTTTIDTMNNYFLVSRTENKDKILIEIDTYHYNIKFRDSVLYNCKFEDNQKSEEMISHFFYDENDLETLSIVTYYYYKKGKFKSKEVYKLRYKYVKFDENGNWIAREEYNDHNLKNISLEKRIIEYY